MSAASARLSDFRLSRGRTVPRRLGFVARLKRSFETTRQRQVDAKIARMIQAGGGRLTDSLERQIEQHLT